MQVILGEIHPVPNARADEEQAAKILEEAAEVLCAWKHYDNSVRCAEGTTYGPALKCIASFIDADRDDLFCECADLVMACGNMVAGLDMALSTEVEPHYQALDKSCVRELLVRAAEVQEIVYRYEFEDAVLCLYEGRDETGERLDEQRRVVEHSAYCVFAGCEEIVCRVAGLVLQLGVEDFTPYMEACEQRNRVRGSHE